MPLLQHYADELTLLKTTVPELDRAVATLKKHNSLRMRSSLRKVASNNAVPAVTTEASAAPTGDAAVNPSSRQTTPQGEGEDTVGPLAGPGEREQTHEATSTAPENGAQGGGAGSREGSRHGKRLQKTPSTRIVGSPVRPQLERISAPQDPSSSSGPAPSRMGQLLRTATFKVSQAIDGKHGQRGHQGIGEGSVRGGMDRAWALEIAREVQELKAMVAKLIAASDSA